MADQRGLEDRDDLVYCFEWREVGPDGLEASILEQASVQEVLHAAGCHFCRLLNQIVKCHHLFLVLVDTGLEESLSKVADVVDGRHDVMGHGLLENLHQMDPVPLFFKQLEVCDVSDDDQVALLFVVD